jgi:ubiquinone/menaquinone biosynthesis C-methylase UbiE
LHRQDVAVFGLDLSPGMVEQARLLNPGIQFAEGNMLALDLPDEALAGLVAFYAIVNLAVESLPLAFAEMTRVLKPNGLLLLSFHDGDETIPVSELWSIAISMEFRLLNPKLIADHLTNAGLIVEELIERPPYAPEVEYQSRRAYIFARKPVRPWPEE